MPASPDEILAMVTFARVVEAKSFTAAAEKLGVSKSAVSMRVAALENELKVTLLHRTTRKLSLTAEGVALYERCARVAAAADDARAAILGTGEAPRGVLRVNAPIAFAEDYLPAPMATYLGRYPDVRVELSLGDRTVDLVEDGIELAIRITTRLRGAGLVARKLATDRLVLCAAPAYLERRGVPASATELLQHDCLVYSLLRVSDEWRFREPGMKEPLAVPVEPRFSAASGAVLRRAAVAGMGLAVLPRFMVAAELADGRLRTVLGTLHAPPLGIYAVYPEARRAPSKVRAFVDVLAAHFKTARW
ncbi:MAG TPA: LysR family transcriptional regulator [Polyangiaceae bacterium]|jgi:DNA-binding transcriptional LysR family regulator|nr:LysR family transcriptional regulator [Polyangiaceae bacterium]